MTLVARARASLYISSKGGFRLDRIAFDKPKRGIFPSRTTRSSLFSRINDRNQKRAPRSRRIGAYGGTIARLLLIIPRFIMIIYIANPWHQRFLHPCRQPLRTNNNLFERHPKHVP